MIYAIKFNDKGKAVALSTFQKEADVPNDLVIYTGDLKPELLLQKTKKELGI